MIIDEIRENLKYVFPVLIIMIIGLILSRMYQPEPAIPAPEVHISAAEAVNHIGTPAKVCGTVVSADYVREIDGKPTFLNFGKPHPNQLFTAVIWGKDRLKWSSPPQQKFAKGQICVIGIVEMYEGTPQIIVKEPEQIEFQKN